MYKDRTLCTLVRRRQDTLDGVYTLPGDFLTTWPQHGLVGHGLNCLLLTRSPWVPCLPNFHV